MPGLRVGAAFTLGLLVPCTPAFANAPLWGQPVQPTPPAALSALPPQANLPAPQVTGMAFDGADPASLCHAAIIKAEQLYGVPDQLLSAIGRIESGRPDPASGALHPWPWTINVEGVGHFYDTKAQVIAAVQDFQSHGARSIDVGCMQVNLVQHPEAFASLDQAFDPDTNAQYGARFLQQLFQQTGSWPRATGAYHSQTPELGAEYLHRVLAEWALPDPAPGGTRRPVTNIANVPQPAPTAAQRLAALGAVTQAAAPTPLPAAPIGGIGRVMRAQNPATGGASFARGLDAYRATPVMLSSSLGLFRPLAR